jgi:hypothetical protein
MNNVNAPLPRCSDCKHYRQTMVFDLCEHSNSTYSVAGRKDQHTAGHMRQHECGPQGRLFEAKV